MTFKHFSQVTALAFSVAMPSTSARRSLWLVDEVHVALREGN